jgi:hypothetical protein
MALKRTDKNDAPTYHEPYSSVGFNFTTGEGFRHMAIAEQQGVRWLAGALGGAGVALAAVVGLANVPNLDSYQPLAVAGMLVALGGIGAGLVLVFQALRPADVSVARTLPAVPFEILQAAERMNLQILDLPLTRFVDYQDWTNADQSVNALDVRDPIGAPRDLRARGLANLPAVAAYVAWQLPGASAVKDPLAERLAELKTALDQLQGYLELRRVRKQVRRARLALPCMAITTVAGLALLLAASAQADDVTTSQAITGPVRVVTHLGPKDRTKAAAALASAGTSATSTTVTGGAASPCALPAGQSFDAVAIGGTWKEPSLLLRGSGQSCPVVQLDADDDTVIVPAIPITTAIPVLAWLGTTHKAELVRSRPKATSTCAAANGPVEATVVGGTWTGPQLLIHAVRGKKPEGPTYDCAAVRLESTDPATTIQPKP